MGSQADTGPRVYRWNSRVASRTLEGTAFVLLDSRMLSLNPVGSRIWEHLRDGGTVEDVARRIALEFDTTEEVAARDAAGFVEDLLARDLVVGLSHPGDR